MKQLDADANISTEPDRMREAKDSTRAEECKMSVESSVCPQTSAMEANTKSKRAKRNERRKLNKRRKLTNALMDAAQTSEIQKKIFNEGAIKVRMVADLSNAPQLADLSNAPQNSAVACIAEQQGGNILKAVETTANVDSTNDGTRSIIEIGRGLSLPEGLACLDNVKTEIEQNKTPTAREDEKMFDKKDGEDIVAKIVKHGDSSKAAETTSKLGSLQGEDNLILRKFLRSPRYFDFPKSCWQMCFTCGENTHITEECLVKKRKKPCYICGDEGHKGKTCKQRLECSKCKGIGHLESDCTEESLNGNSSEFCLKCGDSGHIIAMCQSDYSSEDLKKIRCYGCKQFGHLCCVDYKHNDQTAVSCYNCGQTGHLGPECIKEESCAGPQRA